MLNRGCSLFKKKDEITTVNSFGFLHVAFQKTNNAEDKAFFKPFSAVFVIRLIFQNNKKIIVCSETTFCIYFLKFSKVDTEDPRKLVESIKSRDVGTKTVYRRFFPIKVIASLKKLQILKTSVFLYSKKNFWIIFFSLDLCYTTCIGLSRDQE